MSNPNFNWVNTRTLSLCFVPSNFLSFFLSFVQNSFIALIVSVSAFDA